MACLAQAQQNLIPNPSFETGTPTGHNQPPAGWYSPETCGGGTADLFNTQSPSPGNGAPQNLFGSLMPYDGEAYAGLMLEYTQAGDCEGARDLMEVSFYVPEGGRHTLVLHAALAGRSKYTGKLKVAVDCGKGAQEVVAVDVADTAWVKHTAEVELDKGWVTLRIEGAGRGEARGGDLETAYCYLDALSLVKGKAAQGGGTTPAATRYIDMTGKELAEAPHGAAYVVVEGGTARKLFTVD